MFTQINYWLPLHACTVFPQDYSGEEAHGLGYNTTYQIKVWLETLHVCNKYSSDPDPLGWEFSSR